MADHVCRFSVKMPGVVVARISQLSESRDEARLVERLWRHVLIFSKESARRAAASPQTFEALRCGRRRPIVTRILRQEVPALPNDCLQEHREMYKRTHGSYAPGERALCTRLRSLLQGSSMTHRCRQSLVVTLSCMVQVRLLVLVSHTLLEMTIFHGCAQAVWLAMPCALCIACQEVGTYSHSFSRCVLVWVALSV